MGVSPSHPFGLADDLQRAVELCSEDLRRLDGAVILLTGGTGFVGSWLLELLTWSADRLGMAPRAVVLSRDPAAFRYRRPHLAAHRVVELRRGDVRQPIDPFTADFVVAGASASLAAGDARSDADVVETQWRGGQLAKDFLDRGSRVLFLSSGAAGVGSDAYSVAKRHVEHVLTAGSPGGSAVVARLFTFVGPYLPLGLAFAVGNFYRDALEGRPISIKGDGKSVRSYLYPTDMARWLWAMLVRGEAGSVYDVGSSEPVSILDLAQKVAGLRKDPVPVRVEGGDVASSAGRIYVPDTAGAGSLGLEMSWGLDAALARTWQWLTGKDRIA